MPPYIPRLRIDANLKMLESNLGKFMDRTYEILDLVLYDHDECGMEIFGTDGTFIESHLEPAFKWMVALHGHPMRAIT